MYFAKLILLCFINLLGSVDSLGKVHITPVSRTSLQQPEQVPCVQRAIFPKEYGGSIYNFNDHHTVIDRKDTGTCGDAEYDNAHCHKADHQQPVSGGGRTFDSGCVPAAAGISLTCSTNTPGKHHINS